MKTEEQKNKTKEYMRQWRQKNAEKIKKYRKIAAKNVTEEYKQKRKLYEKQWVLNNPEKVKNYKKNWIKNNPEKMREIWARVRKIPRRIKYHNEYSKIYVKRPCEVIKHRVRNQSQKIYGKVIKGYERHHTDYNSPHNFIVIPMKEHKEIHKLRKARGKE